MFRLLGHDYLRVGQDNQPFYGRIGFTRDFLPFGKDFSVSSSLDVGSGFAYFKIEFINRSIGAANAAMQQKTNIINRFARVFPYL